MPRMRRWPFRDLPARGHRDPGKTAALVTPDRALARRVVAALERWQVDARLIRRRCTRRDTRRGIVHRLSRSRRWAGRAGKAPGTAQHLLLRLGTEAFCACPCDRSVERALFCAARARGAVRQGSCTRSQPFLRCAINCTAVTAPVLCLPGEWTRPSGWSKTGVALAGLPGRQFAKLLRGRRTPKQSRVGGRQAISSHGLQRRPAHFRNDCRERRHRRCFYLIRQTIRTSSFAVIRARRAARGNLGSRVCGSSGPLLQSVDRIVLGGRTEGTWPPQASVAQPADAAPSSASICRNCVSASRHTILRRTWCAGRSFVARG